LVSYQTPSKSKLNEGDFTNQKSGTVSLLKPTSLN
jgi:hypothetical protein